MCVNTVWRRTISRYLALAVIPACWLALMVSLVNRIEGPSGDATGQTVSVIGIEPAIGTSWYSYTRDGAQVGYARSMMRRVEGRGEFYAEEETAIRMELFDQEAWLLMKMEITSDENLQPLAMQGRLQAGVLEFSLQAERQADMMVMDIRGLGDAAATSLPMDEAMVSTSSIYATIASQPNYAGREYQFRTFDPLTRAQAATTFTFQGNEIIEPIDGESEALHFLVQKSGLSSDVWLDGRGRVLRETSSNYTSSLVDYAQVQSLYEQHHLGPLE